MMFADCRGLALCVILSKYVAIGFLLYPLSSVVDTVPLSNQLKVEPNLYRSRKNFVLENVPVLNKQYSRSVEV